MSDQRLDVPGILPIGGTGRDQNVVAPGEPAPPPEGDLLTLGAEQLQLDGVDLELGSP